MVPAEDAIHTPLSDEEIAGRAKDLLTDGNPEAVRVPMSVDTMALESHLERRLSIFTYPAGEDDADVMHGILGLLDVRSNPPEILLAQPLYETLHERGRRAWCARHTWAYEVGHAVLGHAFMLQTPAMGSVKTPVPRWSALGESATDMELEAWKFAGCLLIPPHHLRTLPARHLHISALSRRFGVSPKFASCQLHYYLG